MLTYDFACEQCGLTKEVHCSYADRNNPLPCPCGGEFKKIVSSFVLGSGMYNQPTKKYSARRDDMMAELRSCGIEKISASTQNFDSTCKDLLKEKSRISDQMACGAERQQKILAEKVKASTPSASEVKRLERVYDKKNIGRPVPKKK